MNFSKIGAEMTFLGGPQKVAQPATAEPGSKLSSTFEGAFTDYVRALDPRGEPGAAAFDRMWQGLRGALIHELKKRSLWASPPSYLGVFGWQSWGQKRHRIGSREAALDELLNDCYIFIFVKRLARLRAQLEVKPNVEGLVFLYLRNYLHDRQKHYDPLGFRVFAVLRGALRAAVADGELVVLSGSRDIRGETLLAISDREDPESAAGAATLAAIVRRWNDELLPDLITAGGTRYRWLIARLRRRLFDLEAAGVRVFRCKKLIEPLKDDVRHRWAALFDLQEGESGRGDDHSDDATVVRLCRPESSRWEAADSFDQLVDCVGDRLEGDGERGRTRQYLRTLWGFLRTYAGDQSQDALPSNRRLAALLRIPRERFPTLFETLGRYIRHCQAAVSTGPASTGGRRRRDSGSSTEDCA